MQLFKQSAYSLPRTILVYVGGELVGDGIMKLPFIRGLRALFPDAHITWYAGTHKSVYASVLEPLVLDDLDRVVEKGGIGTSFFREFFRPSPLHDQFYDLVIDTQKSLATALLLKKIPTAFFLSPAVGYLLSDARPSENTLRIPQDGTLAAELEELLATIAHAYGQSYPPYETRQSVSLPAEAVSLAAQLLPEGPTYVGMAPGAGSRNKCWPRESFVALAQALIEKGVQPVILLGPAETDWVDYFKTAAPKALFPLQEIAQSSPLLTMALGRRLAAAVANDSGVGHMLGAAGAPLLTIFGPTSAQKFAPRVQKRIALIRAQDFAPKGTPAHELVSSIPLSSVLDPLLTFLETEGYLDKAK